MNGYEFVKKVLDRDHQDLAPLLQTLFKREISAVEFKASFMPKPGSNDNEDACSWHVISSILAIANSSGGCVLLGVNDSGEYAENFLCGKNLDQYKRSLDTHIKEKKSWSIFGGKERKYSFPLICRNRLKACVDIQEAKLNGKDIIVILIKPSDKVITYNEIISGEQTAREYFPYRTRGDLASKDTVLFSSESLESFENNREIDSDYYDRLWANHTGKPNANFEARFCIGLSAIAILITLLQIIFIYTDFIADTTAKGFDLKFLFLLAGLPVFAIAELFFFFSWKANRKLILCDLVLCGSSFSIAAFTYVLKLFNVGNECSPYSLGIKILITLALFLGIFLYCFFLIPILTPCKHINNPNKSNLPKPDEIDVGHPHLTWEWKCVDGGFWWEDSGILDTPYGPWKFQRNKMFGNFRLLDPRAIMRCYGARKEVLQEFKKVKEIYKEKTPSEDQQK